MQAPEVEIVRQFVAEVRLPPVANHDDSPLKELVDAYPSSPGLTRRNMHRLMERDPAQFFSSACRILKASSEGPGHLCLMELLWRNPVLVISLADPALFPPQSAAGLAKRWCQLDPLLDVKLLHLGFPPDSAVVSRIDAARERRVLAIVNELPANRHILLPLARLLRSHDPQVRSKVATLYCRASRNPEWVRKLMSEPDARLRANAVEGLWGANSEAIRVLLQEAARDKSHRVAANALIGLHQIDSREAVAGLENMARRPEPVVRAAAAFAMGQTLDPSFREVLQSLLKDADSRVRSLVLRSLVRIQRHCSQVRAPAAGEAASAPVEAAAAAAAVESAAVPATVEVAAGPAANEGAAPDPQQPAPVALKE